VQRKQLGAWYTPDELVRTVVDGVITDDFLAACDSRDRPFTVLDPACGDGRFLAAAAERVGRSGRSCDLVGVDIDPGAVCSARVLNPTALVIDADALRHDFGGRRFDLVIGNPPFLSQMASATTRGGASRRSGGPYADAAVEFLALAGELVEPDGGRVALVVPQSLLAARDARQVRASFDDRADLFWSWWTGERVFDAQVHTCALAFHFSPRDSRLRQNFGGPGPENFVTNVGWHGRERGNWSFVVTSRQAIPEVPRLDTAGSVSDRALLNANFRDEYYGMIAAVGDHDTGPPLITSGLIDPATTHWGHRPVTFAKRRLRAPRVDLEALDPKMQRWASKRLVPKVLVANQTSIIEAVCDPHGELLPAVPVIGVYPHVDGATDSDASTIAWEIAAVLTSPIASAWVWHHAAGTGLSATSIRLGPAALGAVPWPRGDLVRAVDALRDRDVRRCGEAVLDAYGIVDATDRERLVSWWSIGLQRITSRASHCA
jgi:SAM-dependent methyltransferase